MTAIFSQILNMSLTGSFVIAIVLVIRLLLKRSPKIFSYILWSVVLFRLLCPVSLSGPVSLLNWLKPEVTVTSQGMNALSYIPNEEETGWDSGAIRDALQGQPMYQPVPQAEEKINFLALGSWVWFLGCSGMAATGVFQYLFLQKRLVVRTPLSKQVYLAEDIDSPFVMGILRPKIYLPTRIQAGERPYILAHEHHHIRRGDHILKLLAYGALCLHWFNPMVWLAFLYAGKDMEMSCDEAVIKQLGAEIRADYSETLLQLSIRRYPFAGTPLAFGEGDTKGRVRNMAKWKKPKVWVSVFCAVICLFVVSACALNPEITGTDGPTGIFSTSGEVSISPRMGGPVTAQLDTFGFTLPKGLSMESSEIENAGNAWDYGYAFYAGDTVAGGLALRYPAENAQVGSREWELSIGVPEAKDASLAHMGSSSNYADWETTYFPDLPLNYDEKGYVIQDENGKFALENEVTHYYFVAGIGVYDLWLYENRSPEELQIALLTSIVLEDTAASEGGKLPAADVELAKLPDGYSRIFNETGGIFFARDGRFVGGVEAYALPSNYDPEDEYFSWLETSDISDFGDSSLYYMGGMAFSGTGSWVAQFESNASDGMEPEVRRYHIFKVAGDLVYDSWYDMNQLSHVEGLDLLDAVILRDSTKKTSSADFAEENTNILISCYRGEEISVTPDYTFLLSVSPEQDSVSIAVVLHDTYVSLPDYRSHVTGNNKLAACYPLGNAWGGAEGAREMINRCIEDNFGILVDHNLELTSDAVNALPDIMDDIAGNLSEPLAPEFGEVAGQILSLIAGTTDSDEILRIKEQLAAAHWQDCTIPFEGTYTRGERDIGGSMLEVWLLKDSEMD